MIKKKQLMTLLRFVVAILGISFIVYIVDWHDHVKAPVGTVLPDGVKLEKPRNYRVTPNGVNVADPTQQLTVIIDEASTPAVTITISASQIGLRDNEFQFSPGLRTMLTTADVNKLIVAMLMVSMLYPMQALRWWLLMRARKIDVTLWRTFRLSMVGCFFNYCMPGTTGGDVVKAYYAAKRSDRRADAVMTVIFDRIAGLVALVVVAGIAGLFLFHDPHARKVTIYIWMALGCAAIGAVMYFSNRVRKRVGIDWIMSKLPQDSIINKIDQAAVAYGDHKTTVVITLLMSMSVHVLLAYTTGMAGHALGMKTSMGLLMVTIPVMFLAGALPLFPQGVGVMEFVALALIIPTGTATANQIVGMLLLARLFQMFYSLFGALVLLRGDIHMHPDTSVNATAD